MKKRIYQNIKDKIISKQNIIVLINHIFNIYEGLESAHKKITISLHTTDSEVYEIENSNLDSNNNILDIKRIENIKIDLTDYRNDKHFSINLSQGDDKWSNNLVIGSKDELWVNNQKIMLEESIKSWQPQNVYYSRYKDLLLHFLAICVGLLIIKIVVLFSDQSIQDTTSETTDPGRFLLFLGKLLESIPLTRYLFIAVISWIVGSGIVIFTIWFKIDNYLSDLWPSIEFDFGPEHFKFSKRRRKSIGVIITLIVLPVILRGLL